MKHRTLQLLISVAFLAGYQARAGIVVQDLYRLGDADPGAVAGNSGNSTTADSVGSDTLSKTGTAAYSSNAAPNSALSMLFQGAGYYSGSPVLTNVTDNFGVEAWIDPTSASYGVIFYDGNSSTNGFGLYYGTYLHAANTVSALYGGVSVGAANVSVSTNQWYDVALVRASGVSTLYVNGTAYALFMGTPNVPVTSALMIGGNPLNSSEHFNGLIDEARIFTFSSGAFNPATDLEIDATTPEPASFAFVGLGIVALWFARRR